MALSKVQIKELDSGQKHAGMTAILRRDKRYINNCRIPKVLGRSIGTVCWRGYCNAVYLSNVNSQQQEFLFYPESAFKVQRPGVE